MAQRPPVQVCRGCRRLARPLSSPHPLCPSRRIRALDADGGGAPEVQSLRKWRGRMDGLPALGTSGEAVTHQRSHGGAEPAQVAGYDGRPACPWDRRGGGHPPAGPRRCRAFASGLPALGLLGKLAPTSGAREVQSLRKWRGIMVGRAALGTFGEAGTDQRHRGRAEPAQVAGPDGRAALGTDGEARTDQRHRGRAEPAQAAGYALGTAGEARTDQRRPRGAEPSQAAGYALGTDGEAGTHQRRPGEVQSLCKWRGRANGLPALGTSGEAGTHQRGPGGAEPALVAGYGRLPACLWDFREGGHRPAAPQACRACGSGRGHDGRPVYSWNRRGGGHRPAAPRTCRACASGGAWWTVYPWDCRGC